MVRELMHNKLPCLLEDLKQLHFTAKETALNSFVKKAIGEYKEEMTTLKE
jgi:hypothetical protein